MGMASALAAAVGTVQMRSSDLSSFRSRVFTVYATDCASGLSWGSETSWIWKRSSTVMGRGWVGGFWALPARERRLSARIAMVRRGPSFICGKLLMRGDDDRTNAREFSTGADTLTEAGRRVRK